MGVMLVEWMHDRLRTCRSIEHLHSLALAINCLLSLFIAFDFYITGIIVSCTTPKPLMYGVKCHYIVHLCTPDLIINGLFDLTSLCTPRLSGKQCCDNNDQMFSIQKCAVSKL